MSFVLCALWREGRGEGGEKRRGLSVCYRMQMAASALWAGEGVVWVGELCFSS